MENYTIAESYTLPSKGKVYSKEINPNIKVRSMTTQEEMKRLGRSDLQYKLISEIMDDCLVEKPGIPAYDLCMGDFQFLLYKLRTVTYGPDYKIESRCPICGAVNKKTVNLDNLEVFEYSDDFSKYLSIELPRTHKKVQLRMQTPRMLDEVRSKSDELLNKSSSVGEPAFLFTLQSVIEKVDGEVLDPVKLEQFVRNLPMMDANYILKSLEKIELGLDNTLVQKCSKCGGEHEYSFPISGEFFGPSIE